MSKNFGSLFEKLQAVGFKASEQPRPAEVVQAASVVEEVKSGGGLLRRPFPLKSISMTMRPGPSRGARLPSS